MDVKIKEAEKAVKKIVHKTGIIFGFKEYAGREVVVVVEKEKENEGENIGNQL